MHARLRARLPVEFPGSFDGATGAARVLRYIELWQYHGYDDGEVSRQL